MCVPWNGEGHKIYKVSNVYCCKQHAHSDAVGFFTSSSLHTSQHMDEASGEEASLIVITLSTLAIRKSLCLYTDGFMLQCYKCAKFHGFTTWCSKGAWSKACANLMKNSLTSLDLKHISKSTGHTWPKCIDLCSIFGTVLVQRTFFSPRIYTLVTLFPLKGKINKVHFGLIKMNLTA